MIEIIYSKIFLSPALKTISRVFFPALSITNESYYGDS